MDYDARADALFRWRLYLIVWILGIGGATYFGIDSSARVVALVFAATAGYGIPTSVENPFIDDALRVGHPEAYEAYGYGSGLTRRFLFSGLPLMAALGRRTDDAALETMKRSVRVAMVFPVVLVVVGVSVWTALGVLG